MSGKQGQSAVFLLMCLVLCDAILSQTTSAIFNDYKQVKNNNDHNNNKNNDNISKDSSNDVSAESSIGKNNNSSVWTSSTTGCSCVQEMSALKRDLSEEIDQRMALKAALDSYLLEVAELKSLVSGNSSRTNIAPSALARSTPSIAFSSKLSYNRELKPLDTVVFDTILTNDGNAYDPDTGKFTAVISGTYFFHSTILSGYNTKVETAIIVNDKEIARIYSGAHDAHGSGSNMAIVDLRSGDSVWIRLLYQGGNHVHGYYSTFSGALLRSSEP